KESARVMDFYVNDSDAYTAMGFGEGVPANPAAAKALAAAEPKRTDGQRSSVEYLDLVREIGAPMKSLTPKGGRDVYGQVALVSQNIAFGKTTIAKGVDEFFSQAEKFLSRS